MKLNFSLSQLQLAAVPRFLLPTTSTILSSAEILRDMREFDLESMDGRHHCWILELGVASRAAQKDVRWALRLGDQDWNTFCAGLIRLNYTPELWPAVTSFLAHMQWSTSSQDERARAQYRPCDFVRKWPSGRSGRKPYEPVLNQSSGIMAASYWIVLSRDDMAQAIVELAHAGACDRALAGLVYLRYHSSPGPIRPRSDTDVAAVRKLLKEPFQEQHLSAIVDEMSGLALSA